MTVSQNGWRVITRAECQTIQVPGGTLAVHPRVATILADAAHRWHEWVEPLVWPGCWGHAVRPIKGSALFSNHASGTAVDLCAPQHPQGIPVRVTFTTRELEAVAVMEERYQGVLEWGGRWSGTSVDGMHWEVAAGVSLERVDALTAALNGVPSPSVPLSPPSAPTTPPPAVVIPGWSGPDLSGAGPELRGDEGNNGPRVAALQQFWRSRYPLYARSLEVDGRWGPRTSAVCRQFAVRSGVRSADGRNIGQQIAHRLYGAGFRG